MEPTSSMFDIVMYPTAIFAKPLEDSRHRPDSTTFENSQLNPKTRLNTLLLPDNVQWRIDGGEADGTRFFAIPSFAVGKPPLRIDVYIPNQSSHPSELHDTLQSHKALLLGGRELETLGISRLVLQRLHSWSREYLDLETTYTSLPFGSRIILEEIRADIERIPVQIVYDYGIERQWLRVQDLQSMWRLAPEQWPPILDHADLKLVSQVHEAISIVQIANYAGTETFVFKSVSTDVKYFYHELKMLLTMEPHNHIISAPLYVVTRKCRFGSKVGVCGFVLKHYTYGTLRDALSQKAHAQILPFGIRLRWAREIVSALRHIQSTSLRFYTDLKPSNILLTEDNNGTLGTLLVDFEQRGSWYSWSPPEVYYVEYLEMLVSSDSRNDACERYAEVLKNYIPGWTPHNRKARYVDSVQGYSKAWLSLTREEVDAAQVFMIGKILWCLFEQVAFPNSCITVETFREEPSDQSFPEFRRTPRVLQECIRRCTAGAPEWRGRLPEVVRCGERLVPRGMEGRQGERLGTKVETQEAARRWWQAEIDEAEIFLSARVRRKNGREEEGDGQVLRFMRARPSLEEVDGILRQSEACFVELAS